MKKGYSGKRTVVPISTKKSIGNIILENKTDADDDMLCRILKECIETYASLYPPAKCNAEFVIVNSTDDMGSIFIKTQQSHIPDSRFNESHVVKEMNDMKKYDAIFAFPPKETDTLTIVVVLDKKKFSGSEQYFLEKTSGSMKDGFCEEKLSVYENRGEKLISFFLLAETLMHEYSHLCSYMSYMETTDWSGHVIAQISKDFVYYDEFLAEYRGITAMLHMAEPYAEPDLFYSLWSLENRTHLELFQEERDAVTRFMKRCADLAESMMLEHMERFNISEKDMAIEIETKTRHGLHYPGLLSENGAPHLDNVEILEYLTAAVPGISTRSMLPTVKNSLASNSGAGMFGMIQAYHDYMGGRGRMRLSKTKQDIRRLFGVSFGEFADVKKVIKLNHQMLVLLDAYLAEE